MLVVLRRGVEAVTRIIQIKAPRGLGDAIYLRAAVLHFLERGNQVTVFTGWPDVFDGLPVEIRDQKEAGEDVRTMGAYASFGPVQHDNFTIACRQVGIWSSIQLKLDWKVRNPELLERIAHQAAGRKILIYQPLKRSRNLEQQLLTPRAEVFRRHISGYTDHFRIKLGHPPYVEDDPGLPCELDMFGKGFIFDTFDVCSIGDLFVSQPSFINVMAEALDRRFVVMFARAGLESDLWVKFVTPDREIHKKHLGKVVYDV